MSPGIHANRETAHEAGVGHVYDRSEIVMPYMNKQVRDASMTVEDMHDRTGKTHIVLSETYYEIFDTQVEGQCCGLVLPGQRCC